MINLTGVKARTCQGNVDDDAPYCPDLKSETDVTSVFFSKIDSSGLLTRNKTENWGYLLPRIKADVGSIFSS